MVSFFTYTQKQKIEILAIGCFDAFHLGHLELLKHLKAQNSALLIIDKFQTNRLVPKEKMKDLCEFDLIFIDLQDIKTFSAKDFLALLQTEFHNLKTLIVGEDFRFGQGRSAGARDIERLSRLKAIIVSEFKLKGEAVHSQLIKEYLSLGELDKANALLGRAYAVQGKVIKGQGLGKKELVPTLNLDTKNYFLPKNGVWASFCKVQNELFQSVSFIGNRFTDGKFSVESHILDENFTHLALQENEEITLIFKAFLRQNQRFNDFSLLKAQIQKDCQNALKCLKERR